MAKAKGIAAKIAEVMAELARLPKDGKNKFHNYTYTTESALMDAVRPKLAERGVAIIPSVTGVTVGDKDSKGTFNTRVGMEFTIADESGEVLGPFRWAGEGSDKGDKGLYKAITGGVKYFLFKLLLVSTGDDPERDDAKPTAPKPKTHRQQCAEAAAELLRVCGGQKQHAQNAAKKYGGNANCYKWTPEGLDKVRAAIAAKIAFPDPGTRTPPPPDGGEDDDDGRVYAAEEREQRHRDDVEAEEQAARRMGGGA